MSCNYAEGLSPYENKGKLGAPEKFDQHDEVETKVDQLAKWIQESKHIVLHTGAGISTSAGIPDFRGPRGVWTLEKKGEKPEINVSWDDAKPTPTHMAIAKLVEMDIVKFVITQNIDGLHLRSGIPRDKLAELHGNMFVDQCDKCKKMIVRDSPAPTVGQKYTGADCPVYKENGRKCRGKLRDFVLDWEDNLPDDDLDISDSHSMMADLSIVMGSTLQIIPAGNMPLYAKKYQENGKVVICNLQPTKHYSKADLNIHTYVDDIMTKLFHKLGISIPEYCSDQDPVRRMADNRDLPESGYIDYTQCPNLAKTFKKRGDDIHEQYLKIKREEKKRKSIEPEKCTKLIKLEEKVITEKKSTKRILKKSVKREEIIKSESKQSVVHIREEVIDIDSDNSDIKVMEDEFKVEIKHDTSNVKDDTENSSDIEILTEVKNESNKDIDEVKNKNCETVLNTNSVRLDKLTNDLNKRLNESLNKDFSKNGDVSDTTDISDTNSDSDAVEVIEEIPIVVQSVTESC